VPTPKSGLYLMAWVSNRNGPPDGDDLDIFYQLIEAP
jgi:hypothetical protein